MVVLRYNPGTLEAELELQVRGQAGQDSKILQTKQHPSTPQESQACETYLDIDVVFGGTSFPFFCRARRPDHLSAYMQSVFAACTQPLPACSSGFQVMLVFLRFHCGTRRSLSF